MAPETKAPRFVAGDIYAEAMKAPSYSARMNRLTDALNNPSISPEVKVFLTELKAEAEKERSHTWFWLVLAAIGVVVAIAVSRH